MVLTALCQGPGVIVVIVPGAKKPGTGPGWG